MAGNSGSDRAKDPGHHAAAAGAPGASGPGDPGYEGEATIGDEGAAAGPESFGEQNGTNDEIVDAAAAALHKRVAEDS